MASPPTKGISDGAPVGVGVLDDPWEPKITTAPAINLPHQCRGELCSPAGTHLRGVRRPPPTKGIPDGATVGVGVPDDPWHERPALQRNQPTVPR